MHALAMREVGSNLEAFRAVERRAPGIAAIHLALGCLWCASLSLGSAVEGASFALVVLAALFRLPATYRLYPSLLLTGVCLSYLAMVSWQLCSNAWSVVPIDDLSDALIPRRLIALLALWPLVAHWRALLAALCIGALIGAVAAAGAIAYHGRLSLDYADLVIARHRSSAGPLAAVGIVTVVAFMFWARSWLAWWGCMVALLLFFVQIAALAGRAPALAAAAGVAVVLIRSSNPPGAIRRRYTVSALAAGAVLALAMLGGPLVERFAQVDVEGDHGIDIRQANIRMVLWREAWTRGMDRPIIGHGTNAWRQSVGAEIAADPERFGVGAAQSRRLSQGNHAHNTLLGAWYGTGAIGVALIVALFSLIIWNLWRAAPIGWAWAAGLGISIVYATVGMFDDLGNVSVGGFLVALLVMLASLGSRQTPSAAPRPRPLAHPHRA
jgi:O-antigen ligase